METGRFFILVAFPVGAFWFFNQPAFFKYFMKGYKLPDTAEGDAQMGAWKEELNEKRRKVEYEKFLREQMAFEEAKRIREEHNI
uniref:Protein PET100 homolog, mitochondrial n=1 Tax=Panagrellus redivivus TaxID=6233 RepID=A0A7E4W1Y7_PANRE